jgi:hypothetical protein
VRLRINPARLLQTGTYARPRTLSNGQCPSLSWHRNRLCGAPDAKGSASALLSGGVFQLANKGISLDGGGAVCVRSISVHRHVARIRHRAAKGWYRDKLGLTPTEENEGGLTYETGGKRFGVYPSQFAGTNQATAMGFEVQDLDKGGGRFDRQGSAIRAFRPSLREDRRARRGRDWSVPWVLAEGQRGEHNQRRPPTAGLNVLVPQASPDMRKPWDPIAFSRTRPPDP